MSEVYEFIKGTKPLLVSIPHSGTMIPDDIRCHMNEDVLHLPDTDWHMSELYNFAIEMGASVLIAKYSRYVVDLNRSPDDVHLYPGKIKTGLFPIQTFESLDIYKSGYKVSAEEENKRRINYWEPYHQKIIDELQEIKNDFGYANLYDAHSIKSELALFFDGILPDLNLGTSNGKTCDQGIEKEIVEIMNNSEFSSVINKRFLGGYITRNYGDLDNKINTVQMELTWKNYMDEKQPYKFLPDRAKKLQTTLKEIMSKLI